MILEKEREALMRLTMCAREECGMCKYKDTCGFDFQYELATKNMNILADALRKTEPTISKMEQVDEPITQTKTQNSNLTFKTLEYCDICDHKGCEECIANALDEHCMPSQFKKQIEDECAKEYEELGLKELKELIEADRKTEPTISKMEQVEDEPQTYCGDFADRLAYERGVKHAWEVAQKVFNSTVTFYEAEDVAKQIDKDINVRSKECE